jgi:glycyl-tRNA synthetase beta chain
MPQLLLELFSEEIPARMQAQAARDLERMARERLKAATLEFERLRVDVGPRRLSLVVDGLPVAQGDRREEKKGPRVSAPEAAIEGFLRSVGVHRHQLTERGGVLFADVHHQGRPTAQIIAEMVEAIVRGFPWPKSMTWGAGKLRWVRPLQRILCVFDREIVPLEIEGLASSDLSEGHRFMGACRPFRARDFDEYREALAGHFVVLEAEARKERIIAAARDLCDAHGLELVEDDGLLEEVAGLAEWPVPIVGHMEPSFLALPPEVIRTSMRTHQKYFAVRYPGVDALAPNFVVVANIEAADGGALVAAGNARVLSARLKDAQFFWEEDLKVPLGARRERLKGVTFHAKLGTMYERAERIEALARQIAPLVGADPARAALAGHLCKSDLVSGMVGEFPELQGVMGGYYARAEGLGDDVAGAIAEHYKPAGPNDALPASPVALAVALADKLDTLAGFFAIGEKPTGARDPFALRRAALGVIRIVLGARLRLPLRELVRSALFGPSPTDGVVDEILAFMADRLKVQLRDEGKRHDLVDAVFALGDDDLTRVVARVEALDAFLITEDGANLLAGYKRAGNLLNAEAKKSALPEGPAIRAPDAPAEEATLVEALSATAPAVEKALAQEDFSGAMRSLAALRGPVDAFFDKVLVNSPIPAERDNRLRLLSQVRAAMDRVANFSLVSG